MRQLILLSALLVPGSVGAAPAPGAPPEAAPTVAQPPAMGAPGARNAVTGEPCRNPFVRHADGDERAEAKKLVELPPANLVLAVMREVDGCNEPVIVGRNYGLGLRDEPEPAAPPPPRPLRPTPL